MQRESASQRWYLLVQIQTSLYCAYSTGNICVSWAFSNSGSERELVIQLASFLSIYLWTHWVVTCAQLYQQFMLSLEPTIHTSKFSTKKAGLNHNPVEFLTNLGISVDDCGMLNSMQKAEEYLVQLWKRSTVKLWIIWDCGCTTTVRLVWRWMSYHQPADVREDIWSELTITPICKLKMPITCWCQQN